MDKRLAILPFAIASALAVGLTSGGGDPVPGSYRGGYYASGGSYRGGAIEAAFDEMWMVKYGTVSGADADTISILASYDGLILSKGITWNDPDVIQDAQAINPDLKIASYAMPSTAPRIIFGAPSGHILDQNQTSLFEFMVGTTRNDDDTGDADCSGGVGADCDTAQYDAGRYVIDLNLAGAIDSVLTLFGRERYHLVTAEPTFPANNLGVFWDIPETDLGPPVGADLPVTMYGDIDFDMDGIAYDIDDQYYSEVGVSCQAAFNRGIRALFAAMADSFPRSVSIGNGIMAVVDSTVYPDLTHIMIERAPQSPPFNWNRFADLLAGGRADATNYPDDDPVDPTIMKSLESYARAYAAHGTNVIMLSSATSHDDGYNHDALSIAARIYGFATSNKEWDNYLWADPPDRTMYDLLEPLGALTATHRNGEHIWGTFANGEAHMLVSLARAGEDDQIDYWAVDASGDTIVNHWHGEDFYTYTFGDHNRQSGDPNYSNYDRWLGLEGDNRKTRFLYLDQSAKDSYMGDAGAESAVRLLREQTSILGDWGVLSFPGSAGVRETSMARVLKDREIKSATLYLYTYWTTRTIAAGDTLFIGAPNTEDLVGWDLPIVDQGSGWERPQSTYNEKTFGGGSLWKLDQYPNPAGMGGVWTSLTDITLTASTYYTVDVTDLIKAAADPDSFFAGLWLYYRAGLVGSSELGFDAFSTYLDVEVYVPRERP